MEINEESTIIVAEEDILAATHSNEEQKYAYNLILSKVFTNESTIYFIDGLGGTCKTYSYLAILANVRSKNIIALATTSSGVAAVILPGGRTAYSRFKFPLQIDNNISCNISKQSGLAKLLQITRLIIWDKAPMISKYVIEALDVTLKDINDCNLPFGGKMIVLGGDFRQVLPIIPEGTKEEIINASVDANQPFICNICLKKECLLELRARIMVELRDQTETLEAIMFGKNAEIFLSCSANTTKSDVQYIVTTFLPISTEETKSVSQVEIKTTDKEEAKSTHCSTAKESSF
ncbi:uncharacterized protein LOC133805754 [Humulus lupulus]|uniref:uncharacterized protein LOC133805754 n=1 Tax=Humulus lupulus TaxID=3486 RepID=UPI002B4045B6|nr:uncharacterized protein LOC133805754 [Humulus lupulus]